MSQDIEPLDSCRISRRGFGRQMAGVGAASILAACEGPMVEADGEPAQPEPSRPEYVDFHTHLGQKWGNRPVLTVDELLRWMDENGIVQAVVHPLESPEAYDYPITTNYILERTALHRDRLIPAAVIDPRVINLTRGEDPKLGDLLARYKEHGARVFGEHKPGLPMDDPQNLELYAACADVDLPVLFHLDSRRCTDEVGLPKLEHALQQVPDCTFVGHAQGFWASISGDVTRAEFQGYPEGEVQPGGALDRLLAEYPNLYGDLGAGSGANAIARDIDFGRDFIIRHADRLVWSSDYLAPGREVRQLDLYPRLELPSDVRRKVFRANSRRLLGMG